MQAGICPHSGYGFLVVLIGHFHGMIVSYPSAAIWIGLHGEVRQMHQREFHLRVSWTWNISGTP